MMNKKKTLFLVSTLMMTTFSAPVFPNPQESKLDFFLNHGNLQNIEKIGETKKIPGISQQISPPKFIEEPTKSGTLLLQLDEGEAMLKMVTCLQTRLPGFPTSAILDLAKQTALAAMRVKNGSSYFPQELLHLSCADSDFERYFDNQKIATTQGWQKLLKMYQDAPVSAESPGKNPPKEPKEPKEKKLPKSPKSPETNQTDPKEKESVAPKSEGIEIGQDHDKDHDQEQSATLSPNDYI